MSDHDRSDLDMPPAQFRKLGGELLELAAQWLADDGARSPATSRCANTSTSACRPKPNSNCSPRT